NSRKRRELLLDGVDQFRLRVNVVMPRRILIRAQADIEFVVEESGWVGSIVGTAQLIRHGCHLGKTQQNLSNLWRKPGCFIERNGIGRGGAHPQCRSEERV